MENGWFVVLVDTNNGKRVASSTERDGQVLEEVHDLSKLPDRLQTFSDQLGVPLFDTDCDEMIE